MNHADAVPIAELVNERRYLLDVADRMSGGRGEAESVVDEAYRRWCGLPDGERRRIAAPRSWLAQTVGRISRSRQAQSGRAEDPARMAGAAERPRTLEFPASVAADGDQVSRVLLDVLAALSPAERFAFESDDAPATTPGTDAEIAGRSERECAELADRARARLRLRRSRPTSPQQHDALARAVRQACLTGDADLLASLLSPDATAYFDGGGKVRTPTRPVHGSRQVAHTLLTVLARCPRTTLTAQPVNGRTGLVARYDHQVAAVVTLDVAEHRVGQVWVVLNPDKLRSWNQPPAQTSA